MSRIRLDKLLLERALAPTRERAQAMVLAGRVLVNQQKIEKPGTAVPADAELRILGQDLRYVSRGGFKLEGALEHWAIAPAGRTCLDVGASTGGFTDCLLQHGAVRVIAVDTGYGQIAAGLRSDPRVRLLERCNARYLRREQIAPLLPSEGRVDLAVIDVAFISATLVLPAVVEACGRPLELVVLVKPQFEVGRKLVGKGGIVRDPAAQRQAVERVRQAAESLGASEPQVIDSPILGTEGNREFLLHCWLR